MYVLTAVIPVYGISRNIENLRKVFTDIPLAIQIIVVHDTTDGEDTNLLREITSPPNFAILEVAGGTAGKTRNRALPFINSEWTVFWDADDRPSPTAILEAISESKSDETELIVASFSDNSMNDLNLETNERISAISKVEDSFLVEFGMWRCIFRSANIKDDSFNDLKIGEDLAFILRALPVSRRNIHFSGRNVYEYRRNSNGSVTNSPLINDDFVEAIREISKLSVEGHFRRQFKDQVLLSLLASQFKRFPSTRKFLNLVKFCLYNPAVTKNKVRELMKR
jgi:glycosyltransferase involved in cell wall biosynthesis